MSVPKQPSLNDSLSVSSTAETQGSSSLTTPSLTSSSAASDGPAGGGTIQQPRTVLKSVLLIVLFGGLLGWATYFRGYAEPAVFYWDENYHVASAQKYLNGIFFQEPHPPLGKLLIAAGEYLLDANADDSQFIDTNHADKTPVGFSFAGYRLFPAILAALTTPLFGILAWQLSGSLWAAALAIGAFGFDNALIVHLRGAMLEGPQLFFLVSAALAVLVRFPVLAGIMAGAAIATKINSIPSVVVVLGLLAARGHWREATRVILVGTIVWIAVWQIHFALGQKILADTYKSSPALQTAIRDGRGGSIALLPTELSEALAFSSDYQRGVPSLNMCKTQENGSYPLLWPLGAQSINYRWEREDGRTSYLYLQANPAIWLFSLIGILLAAQHWSMDPRRITALSALVVLYGAGLALPLVYDRVFYLYHFFIPLLCGALAGALLIARIQSAVTRTAITIGVLGIFFATFRFFAPLTYSVPLTDQELQRRAWIDLWNLRCAQCESEFPIARPVAADTTLIAISGRKAYSVTQGWGSTRMGLTDEGAPLIVNGQLFHFGIGTHANGALRFIVPEGATVFSAAVGVPDTYRGRQSSIQFSVESETLNTNTQNAQGADDTRSTKVLWRSAVMHPGDDPVPVDVALGGVTRLILRISDADDGNTDDHGAWLEPVFK